MQNHFILTLIILFLLWIIFSRAYIRRNKVIRKQKVGIYQWMKMGKNRRNKLDQIDRFKVMQKKKELILKTRKEYLNYTKSSYK